MGPQNAKNKKKMNTTEIRALVASKIAGQGMMVDAGASLQPVIESLCNIIDAQAEQLAGLKEYTAGLGIDISESGKISVSESLVAVDSGAVVIDDETFAKINTAAMVKVGDNIYPRGPITQLPAQSNTDIYAFFGEVKKEADGTTKYNGYILQVLNGVVKRFISYTETISA